MVRISDARMSGTAYGTVVLHVCPEAAAGGPLALVENGDMIELDVEAGRLHLDVAGRRAGAAPASRWRPPAPAMTSGYQKLYVDHVMQAIRGRRSRLPARLPRRRHPAREPLRRTAALVLRSDAVALPARNHGIAHVVGPISAGAVTLGRSTIGSAARRRAGLSVVV